MTQRSPEPPKFESPAKRKRRAPVTDVDDFDKNVIRRTVLSFYERKELPTLHKIREELREKDIFEGSLRSLSKVMHNLGFKYGKVNGLI